MTDGLGNVVHDEAIYELASFVAVGIRGIILDEPGRAALPVVRFEVGCGYSLLVALAIYVNEIVLGVHIDLLVEMIIGTGGGETALVEAALDLARLAGLGVILEASH